MYFITVIRTNEDNLIEDSKTVGYFSDKGEAERCTKENAGNIFAGGQYQYAIVSEVDTGMFPGIKNQYWYHFLVAEDGFWIDIEECDVPEELRDFEPSILG